MSEPQADLANRLILANRRYQRGDLTDGEMIRVLQGAVDELRNGSAPVRALPAVHLRCRGCGMEWWTNGADACICDDDLRYEKWDEI